MVEQVEKHEEKECSVVVKTKQRLLLPFCLHFKKYKMLCLLCWHFSVALGWREVLQVLQRSLLVNEITSSHLFMYGFIHFQSPVKSPVSSLNAPALSPNQS
jgi:hypothetical protein